MTPRSPVLVTGCSSGIGVAVAEQLARAGHTVWATARRPEMLTALARLGARTMALDVTSEDSMRAVVDAVVAEHGMVGTLVNNAGYGEYGPVEEADLDRVRTMFETNVFGLSRLMQLVLPSMREAGGGTIVNMGSMGGRFALPVGGYYHASKYALEAISDSLRAEVAPFGIRVVLIEPGPIRTGFESRVVESLEANTPAAHEHSAYHSLVEANRQMMAGVYGSRALAATPQRVASVTLRAIESERPRARYVITPAARAMIGLRRFGGDRLWDAVVRTQMQSR